MQRTQKEDKQKPTVLTSPGNTPPVIKDQELPPHEVEREILLKTIRLLKKQIKRLKDENDHANVLLHAAYKEVDLQEKQTIKAYRQYYQTIDRITKSFADNNLLSGRFPFFHN